MRLQIPISMLLAAFTVSACTSSGSDASRSGGPSERASTPPESEAADLAELRVSTTGWATDFSKHEVPLDEFISGGPGKDGIPAIDEPRFEAVGDVDWLEPDEPVIAFGVDDDWRAYPIQILVWHEIVNDEFGDQPVTITFCPLCHTAIAFDGRLNGRTLDFGTTGNLRHSDLVMYDRQTETWWQQATGRAVVGELAGQQLEFLPSQLISWERFRATHPTGRVLSRDTGHARDYGSNPYAGYDRADSDPFLLADETLIDGRLSPKVRVLGLVVEDEAAAYPFPFLATTPVVNDDVGGLPVVIVWAPDTVSGLGAATVAGGEEVGAANAFSREIDGRTLTFASAGEGQIQDEETGTTWSFEGRALDGDLAGSQLELLVSDSPFWFAWAVFRPDTEVWQP